jgi:hypothetical protein
MMTRFVIDVYMNKTNSIKKRHFLDYVEITTLLNLSVSFIDE